MLNFYFCKLLTFQKVLVDEDTENDDGGSSPSIREAVVHISAKDEYGFPDVFIILANFFQRFYIRSRLTPAAKMVSNFS